MCHVSHLTDALLGMVALSLAACVAAGSSTGVVCVLYWCQELFP